MKHDYIMTHTPRQIAADHDREQIEREIRIETPFDVDELADMYGNLDPAESADTLPDIDSADALLHEWYDDRHEPRPIDAATLALALHLYAAWYLAE